MTRSAIGLNRSSKVLAKAKLVPSNPTQKKKKKKMVRHQMENRDPYEIHKSKTQKAIIRIITWVSQKKKKRGEGEVQRL